jgi:hypothetical protein
VTATDAAGRMLVALNDGPVIGPLDQDPRGRSNPDFAGAIDAMKRIKTVHRKLDEALTPGGTADDEITVVLTKIEVGMLLACIDNVVGT